MKKKLTEEQKQELNKLVEKISAALQSYMKKQKISFMTADECADFLAEKNILQKTPPKPGFNFRQLLRYGRDKQIKFVSGAEQERPHTKWKINRV